MLPLPHCGHSAGIETGPFAGRGHVEAHLYISDEGTWQKIHAYSVVVPGEGPNFSVIVLGITI